MRITTIAIATAAAIGLGALPAQAAPLKNMERERATLLTTLLDTNIGPGERQKKRTVAKQRLVDLERMVLRDKDLRGDTRPIVRQAFANYDLSFLVHASVESGTTIADHWLNHMGLTTSAITNAEIGRR